MRNFVILLSILICMTLVFSGNRGDAQGNAPGNSVAPAPDGERVRMVLQSGHAAKIESVVISPDGNLIVSGSWDGTICMWSRKGELLRIVSAHAYGVSSVVFSPDGRTIASGSYDKTIRLWDLNGQLLKTFVGHDGPITSISFSPDGRMVASGSWDKSLRLWRRDGVLLHTLKEHADWVTSVVFSPDGKLILSRSNDKTVRLWSSGGLLKKVYSGFKTGVDSIAFNNDGKMIAIWTHGKLRLWSMEGVELNVINEHGNMSGGSLAFSPDGNELAGALWDNTIRIWNRNGILLRTCHGHTGKITSIAFSADGHTIVSSSEDKTIRIWRRDGTQMHVINMNMSKIAFVKYSNDKRFMAIGSEDGEAYLSSNDGTFYRMLRGHERGVSDVFFSPDGTIIASQSNDGIIRLWKSNGKLFKRINEHFRFMRVRFTPDGKSVYGKQAYGYNVNFWNLKGNLARTIPIKNNPSAADGLFGNALVSPDGQSIALMPATGRVSIVNLKGKLLYSLGNPSDRIVLFEFSPDGHLIASVSRAGKIIRLWSSKGKLLNTLTGHSDEITTIVFSPDGGMIASASSDRTVRLWGRTGELLGTLHGHSNAVEDVVFSSDGRMVATVSNKTIYLWNRGGKFLKSFSGHSNYIIRGSVAFGSNGQMLTSASADNTIRHWDVKTEKSISFTQFNTGNYFVSTDDGRFDCSPGSEKHIKFVKGLTPYEPDQFWKKFHTPRLMKRFMDGEKFAPIDINDYVPNAPKVAIVSPSESYREHKDETITIRVKAEPAKNGLGDVFLYHNGRVLDHKSKGVSVKVTGAYRDFTVALLPGQANAFVGGAYDRDGNAEGRSGELVVYYKPGVVIKPDMYVLAVGVSDYQTKSIRLVSPSADARSIASAFKDISGSLYGNYHAEVLTDGAATREGILRKFKELSARIKNTDTVILYFSGHGIMRKGTYYFLPHDAKLDDLGGTSISVDHIENFIAGQYGNKVAVFLDTCQSGSVTGRLSQLAMAKSVEEQVIIAQLARQRGMLVFTAAGGSSDAYDVKGLGNSIFTYCLIDALKNRRDRIRDDKNLITITKLMAEVKAMVPGVSKKYLAEEQLPDFWGSRHDFAVGK
ncbi:MAG TPA: caspase family protein [Spirochaetota bacterium]|nr:caspase family protein [Spirochaetota bacterium]